jgi:hypothetical protein
MSINFFKPVCRTGRHTIPKVIKTSLCESAAVADVYKFLINLYSGN